MGINIDFIFDPEVENAHPENDIRSVIWDIEILDAIATAGGKTTLSQMGVADDDEEEEGDGEGDLFAAQEGIDTIEFLLRELRWKPKDKEGREALAAVMGALSEGPEILVQELEDLLACLKTARRKKAHFRFLLA